MNAARFHHFPVTCNVKIHCTIHLGTFVYVPLRLWRHGGPENAASFLLVVRFYRLVVGIGSDSFTILGLWVPGLAVSNISESQLQTCES